MDKTSAAINWQVQLNHQLTPQRQRHFLTDGLVVEIFKSPAMNTIEVRVLFDTQYIKSVSTIHQQIAL